MRGLLLLATVIAVSSAPPANALSTQSGERIAYRPGRLLVKYRNLETCLDCRLARGERLAPLVGDDSLDELHRVLGVRGARVLFGSGGETPQGRAATRDQRLDAVRSRFPARAARAPSGLAVPDLSRVYALDLRAETDLRAAAALYAENPHVAYAQPDYQVTADLTPNDALFGSLWNMTLVEAPLAWDVTVGSGTVVAVVDTGVDRRHPDLAANMWVNPGEVAGNGLDDDGNGFVDDRLGWNFVGNDGDPFDDHGHGTHVAGIAAATGQNGTGVIGLAFGAQVMAVKGLDEGGSGFVSDLAEAIVYAAENGADVINNSWGGPGINPILVDAVDTARALGAVVVAAAGNGTPADNHEPSAIPGVVAVGASDVNDDIAGFSSTGLALSVAAPGVDVLSLRGSDASGLGNDDVVDGQYQRLSGTSMASPHVAGLAALLLAGLPGLSADEVRWHIELNADQPGYPGYEGQPWNPAFGWGRINAARAFETPPVTTRLRSAIPDLHAIVDTPLAGTAEVDLAFTTNDPVAWTLDAPSWIQLSTIAGTGNDRIVLDLAPTGLPAGATLDGSLTVEAPTVPDGGGSVPLRLRTHRDERLGGVVELGANQQVLDGPLVESDGVGFLVAHADSAIIDGKLVRRVVATHVDSAGNPGPVQAAELGFEPPSSLSVGFDGRQYLAIWRQRDDDRRLGWVKGIRLHPDGTPIDATPFIIDERRLTYDQGIFPTAVGFDGSDFVVLWGLVNLATDRSQLYVRRIGSDGSLRGRRAERMYPDDGGRPWQFVLPRMACRPGRCLVAWYEFTGGGYDLYARALVGGLPLAETATRVMIDTGPIWGIASDGTDFAIQAERSLACLALPTSYGKRVMVARVRADASPVDTNGTAIDNAPGACPLAIARGGLVFDGADYAGFFVGLGPTMADGTRESYGFAARMAPDGTVRDDESTGLLLHEAPTIDAQGWMTTAAASRMQSLFVWSERDPVTLTLQTLRERRVRRRAPTPGYPEAEIGAIGTPSIAEGQDLLLTVRPPAALNPGTTVLSASTLPPGAFFDAPTGAFRWRPNATEAGSHAGVTFTATDASQSLSEAITIDVAEAVPSFRGLVRLADGTPVTDVALKIGGVPGEKRVAFTDAGGRYHVAGLLPSRYPVKLDRASKKRYRQLSPRLKVTLGTTDVVAEDLVLEPR